MNYKEYKLESNESEQKKLTTFQKYIKLTIDHYPHKKRIEFYSFLINLVEYTPRIQDDLEFLWFVIDPYLSTKVPQGLSRLLLAFEPYRCIEGGEFIITRIAEKIIHFDFGGVNFLEVQKIIQVFELLDIEIPEFILERWNELLKTEGESHHTNTPEEQKVVDEILQTSGLNGFSVSRNEYILGFEVDIVLWDANNCIFAIIESDGISHAKVPKKRKSDSMRDKLFYRQGITDLIIRKTKTGCRIVERI